MTPFFIFMIALFLLAVFLRIDFFFTVLYLFVGIYIVLRIWSERIIKNLFIRRNFIDRAFVGDDISVNVNIRNGSLLPIPWLLVSEEIHWSLATTSLLRRVISFKGKETHTFTYKIQAKQRGYYRVGPTVMYTGDLLGLRSDLTERLAPDRLVVYPKIIPLVELSLPTHSPQAALPATLPIFEDPARITGIRRYRWGDNPRHIHWPATAKTGQVMIKQFRPSIARESFIFLNLTRPGYFSRYREAAIELAITTTASLIYHILTKEKLPVGFYTTAMDPFKGKHGSFHLPAAKEKGQLSQILEILARIQPIDDDGGEFLKNLRHKTINLSWGTTVIVITGKDSDALLKNLFLLQRKGLNTKLVLVDKYSESEETGKYLIPTLRIKREKDIKGWGLNH
jgi:uncharacterized protein (DUF58 family)